MDGFRNKFGFLTVVSGQYNHIPFFLTDHFIEIITIRIDFHVPASRIFSTPVIFLYAVQILLQFISCGSINQYRIIDLMLREFLQQTGMEMAWIQHNQLNLTLSSGKGMVGIGRLLLFLAGKEQQNARDQSNGIQ